ncbi:hypothetical protein RRF57_010396 [Xylaria bambusicola]|uniref:Heterokaryon incompatibility domain-containing protein n=1 Tax=Xylaria bambusicola TaxID=326684 RepID=A0AAN7UWJ9_9PEZI
MSRIYWHARHILVYIGEAANDSDFVLTSLGSHNIFKDRFKSAWKYLLQRPYWTRAWVIQETAAAHTATVICGDKKVPSTLLADYWFFSASTTLSLQDERFFKLHILNFLTPKSSTRPTGFLNVLDISRICQAKDPRDKVYAILGLLMDESYRGLTVDYNLKVEDLYIKVALDLAAQYGWANVLRRAGIEHRSIKTLPSWVPDWSHPIRDCSEITLHQFHDEAVRYDVSDNTLSLKVCRIGFSDPWKVHLFDIEAYGDSQRYNSQSN